MLLQDRLFRATTASYRSQGPILTLDDELERGQHLVWNVALLPEPLLDV
jgi:hypothetical protein